MALKFNISDTRYLKAFKTSSASLVVQVINALTSFISVPLIINAVGVERFGLWAAISAALSFLAFSDFGLGIGMQNRMSTFIGRGEKDNVVRTFATSFYTSIFFALVICGAANYLADKFDYSLLIKYNDETISYELVSVIRSVVIVMSLGLVAGIIQRAFDAHQEGYYHKYIGAFSRAISLILLFIATHNNASLSLLIVVFNGIPHICLIAAGLWKLLRKYKLQLHIKYFSIEILRHILKLGFLGLGAGLSMFFTTQAIPILLSITHGLADVAAYSVVIRLLSLIILFYNMVIMPIWPAVTDACAKNDMVWIKNTLVRMRKYVFMSLFIILTLFLLLSKPIIVWWTGASISPSFFLIVVCSFFTALLVWNAQVSVFLNGASLFKGQSTYGLIIALLSVAIAYYFRNIVAQEFVILIVSFGVVVRNICMEIELKYKLLNK